MQARCSKLTTTQSNLLWEGRLEHKFVCLIVEVVVEKVTEQAVDEDSLALEVVAEGGGAEPAVKDGPHLGQLPNLHC